MNQKVVYNTINGTKTIAFENPVRAGNYLLPANSTEIAPPEFDSSTHICTFNGTEWNIEKIQELEPQKTPEPVPAIEQLRQQRDQLLRDTDWRDLPSYPGTNQAAWRTYRQALRDLPATQEPELDEKGNLTNVAWPEAPA